jgi:hypothetical protein
LSYDSDSALQLAENVLALGIDERAFDLVLGPHQCADLIVGVDRFGALEPDPSDACVTRRISKTL